MRPRGGTDAFAVVSSPWGPLVASYTIAAIALGYGTSTMPVAPRTGGSTRTRAMSAFVVASQMQRRSCPRRRRLRRWSPAGATNVSLVQRPTPRWRSPSAEGEGALELTARLVRRANGYCGDVHRIAAGPRHWDWAGVGGSRPRPRARAAADHGAALGPLPLDATSHSQHRLIR